ncbi:MAG TPA: exodeoxyribonuclease III [Prolixibacteraceae bacterium]|nr:exodeoxyribonuclease III [Prolixibacteraceae bacterium]
MKSILSYNVNGIRSALTKGLLDFLVDFDADIVCLQEIKAQAGQMAEEEFERSGYFFNFFSAEKKGYSGVAVLTKEKPDHVEYGIGKDKYDSEGRVIRVDFGDVSYISVYFPSGTTGEIRQSFKMDFLIDFQEYLQNLKRTRNKLVISGDFNICRLWIDIHNPEKQQQTSGFLPEERGWFSDFIALGYVDSFREINSEMNQFSWWSYRAGARNNNKGWRIDYNIVTENLKSSIVDAGILPKVVHSDHCPVWVRLDI